eukprot:g8742.t1
MHWYSSSFTKCLNASIIWIRSGEVSGSDIDTFARVILPELTHSFILITTDGDLTVPAMLKEGHRLLSHPLLLRWYTQNYGFYDPATLLSFGNGSTNYQELRKEKIRLLPIGLDLHTRWKGGTGWQGLVALRNTSRKMLDSNRYRLYVDQMGGTHPVRKQIADILKCVPDLVRAVERLPQSKVWEAYLTYGFALAPRGNGLDTHRFWEMLFLGTIPVVESSSLDPLYTGLPVLILKQWTQLCSVNWAHEYARLSQAPLGFPVSQELMTMPYWFNRAVRTDGPLPSYFEPTQLHRKQRATGQPSLPPGTESFT